MIQDGYSNSPQEIKALLAEDDDLHREIIAELMQDAGMRVAQAEDGAQTIRMIEEEEYDVVVSDLVMPERNGIEVLRAAKAKNPRIHVVIITGFGTMETLVEAIREGAYDYITKPFKLEELRLLLRNVCERIALERENAKLATQLEQVREKIVELEKERAALAEELEVVRNRMAEREKALSALLEQFPFLTGSTGPAQLTGPGEEERKRPGREGPEDKKLITKV